MNDLSAPKTFKSSAFEPSDDELTKAAKARRKRQFRADREDSTTDDDVDVDMAPPFPKKLTSDDFDLDDSSDEELPDVADLLAGRSGKKKVRKDKEVKRSSSSKVSAAIEDVSLFFFIPPSLVTY